MLLRPRHVNNRKGETKKRGQSLVEFALISMLLFTLFLGIIEMGRLLFIFTIVSQAAQEGVRYGAVRPGEIIDPCCRGTYPVASTNPDPCNIVSKARSRVVLLRRTDVSVTVRYDQGDAASTTVYPFSSSPPQFLAGQRRVVVEASYRFNFLVGILDRFIPNGLRVAMTAARTIQVDNYGPPWPATCSEEPPP